MKGIILLFRLFQIVSVYLFAFRMFGHLHQQQFISTSTLTKIGTSIFVVVFILNTLTFPHEIWRWGLLVLFICSQYFVSYLIIFQREKRFQENFLFCLDRLLVLLRAGWGFRSALDKIVDEASDFEKAKLTQIRSFVVFSQHKEEARFNKTSEFIKELRQANKNPHESVRRIQNLRRRLRVERDFRHKSGQILFQIRFQSWILAGLYIALLILVLSRDGSIHHLRFLALSGVLFIIGMIWTFSIGRRLKWKI